MPGTRGPDVAAQLRLKWPDLRVLFVSGYFENPLDRLEATGGAVDFLSKPFSPVELAQRVRLILDRQPPDLPTR